MHIGMRHIRYFVAVAEELHFRRAAERLNISQPALSRAIRHIETEVGVQLFERSNRHVALTYAGANFLRGCSTALTYMDGAIDQAQKATTGEKGHLVIGYTDIAIAGRLPQILKSFRQRYPEVTLEPRHDYTEAQLKDLEAGALDFGFVTGPMLQPGLDSLAVQHDGFIVILYASHPLVKEREIALDALAGEPFVLGTTSNWTYYHDHLYRLCRDAGFQPDVVQTASNSEGIFGLIACEMGISIQAKAIENCLRRGLETRPLKDCAVTVPTLAAWNRETLTPVKQRFIDHLAEQAEDLVG
ncbi:LysR family transcriptional regulator [Pelagibius litoralis]|uniref:LysR family transcriptional regulator n=1 Tax=Pelagibius litoralis TaxID=374515 RepID=A0A967CB81_9PROT|nr:LysR family transcriptional regulator [Pelagibius litoralis]NIA67994.1 LysR family transcriptional regulator [Pelagibius litoralis]